MNTRKNRPSINEWLWPEVLRPLPKRISEFTKNPRIPTFDYNSVFEPPQAGNQLRFDSVVIGAFEPPLLCEDVKLRSDFGLCFSYHPEFSAMLYSFCRERLRHIEKHPVRQILYCHSWGSVLVNTSDDELNRKRELKLISEMSSGDFIVTWEKWSGKKYSKDKRAIDKELERLSRLKGWKFPKGEHSEFCNNLLSRLVNRI